MKTADELKVYLSDRVNKIADDYDIKLSLKAYDARFQELIETLGKPGKIVILIDEYDKPILDNVTNKNIEVIRETLESFYADLEIYVLPQPSNHPAIQSSILYNWTVVQNLEVSGLRLIFER